MLKQSALFLLLSAAGFSAFAQATPEGLWRSIDDDTNKPKAEIRIVANAAGVLTGKVEKALIESKEPLCTACTDERKDKPKIGMEIIRGAKKSAVGIGLGRGQHPRPGKRQDLYVEDDADRRRQKVADSGLHRAVLPDPDLATH